jgi:hypothetical protein
MDLLRLALERCKTADEAIRCITSLLEQYGQNANGGYKNKNFYYHILTFPDKYFQIENLFFPDDDQREMWLRHLRYCQFSFNEMSNGTAWRILNS